MEVTFVAFQGIKYRFVLFDLVVGLVHFDSVYDDKVFGLLANFMVVEMFGSHIIHFEYVVVVGVEFKLCGFLSNGFHQIPVMFVGRVPVIGLDFDAHCKFVDCRKLLD